VSGLEHEFRPVRFVRTRLHLPRPRREDCDDARGEREDETAYETATTCAR
jgi:hypothetical protein